MLFLAFYLAGITIIFTIIYITKTKKGEEMTIKHGMKYKRYFAKHFEKVEKLHIETGVCKSEIKRLLAVCDSEEQAIKLIKNKQR